MGEQRVTLKASLGLLSTSKELVWTPRTEPAPQDGWERNPLCRNACGCATGGPGSLGVVGVVLAMLVTPAGYRPPAARMRDRSAA